ncbi:hypothetical protein VTI28DRAFT_7133 [Corynascus sepedonium]
MASTSILSQTLSSITAIKLEQLQKQKNAYETQKQNLRKLVASEGNTAQRARKLLKGYEELQSLGLQKNAKLSSLDEFLDQAEYDPSVTESLLKEYEDEIYRCMDAQTNKYEFASLYGKLVEEWIASGSSDAADSSDVVVVGREEMYQQRATWEKYVFEAKETDRAAIKAYLDGVFSSKEAKRALHDVRKNFSSFQKGWKKKVHFNENILEKVIAGMLRSDILTEEKRTTLRDFKTNKVVLAEIADVLNMRMSAIATWTWGSPLVVEQRRNLNGRYRFYTDEDLLHSIFVYYVGIQWALQLSIALSSFIKAEGVWQPDTKQISKADIRRRCFFLDSSTMCHPESLQKARDSHFHEILLNQLPDSFDEVRDTYGGLGDEEGDSKPSHVSVVQDLLRRIQAEIIIRTKQGSDVTVIRSDFKWFGPSLPHSTIFTVLEYFGVKADWIDFFRRVLETDLKFKQDPPDVPARTRKRGTLISTPLTDFFGESILFCLDYAVNQKASGTRLYRLHDDMWLWGSSEACGKAWDVVTVFTNTMGLELNLDKTGSALIRSAGSNRTGRSTVPSPGSLPEGDVKWGFLKLDPATGRFLINQQEVDKHIDELRLQLSACQSVLDYIQAWNIYGHRFFANNFGKPGNSFGRAHVDSMLATFRRIQSAIFPDHLGGVAEYLKRTIASRFGVALSDIPDGYLYWPSSMGGLGLQNPFVSLLVSRSDVKENPDKLMDKYFEEEELWYAHAKARFEGGNSPSSSSSSPSRSRTSSFSSTSSSSDSASSSSEEEEEDYSRPSRRAMKTTTQSSSRLGDLVLRYKPEYADLQGEPFMSLAEFGRYRERTDPKLGAVYRKLIAEPEAQSLDPAGEIRAALEDGQGMGGWYELSAYEQWVVQLYHRDMVGRFGGVDVVDRGLLPAGLIGMLRESRFRWQG